MGEYRYQIEHNAQGTEIVTYLAAETCNIDYFILILIKCYTEMYFGFKLDNCVFTQ